MEGSPYGTRCGAYATGDEQVGVSWTDRAGSGG
jgi:hypothetical protein